MKRKAWLILGCMLSLLALAFACVPVTMTAGNVDEPSATTAPAAEYVLDDPLLKSAGAIPDNARVFYEIFVGSFADSDRDGVGDLRGIIEQFDYLNDGDPNSGRSLGVEGIWLTPIFQSPSYHKYDVTDYYTIDPAFGSQADLDELIALCHSRDVKLILDLVINHTALDNPWFQAFADAHRRNDPADPYYDFYAWYGQGEQAPAGRAFAPLAGTDILYECNFYDGMPELNFDEPAVREEIGKLSRYYLDRGIDGFRFDAAKYIYYGDHTRSVAYWKEYLGALRKEYPGLYTVAEVWDGDGVTGLYCPAANCFNFSVSGAEGLLADTAKQGNAGRYAAYVEQYLASIRTADRSALFVPFLSNHDMDRVAGYLTEASGFMRMGANLYLLGPGSPFIYYGEELGMRGSRGASNTDANRRLAMVWGDGNTVQDPDGSTYDGSKQIQKGAQEQRQDPDSLYTYYKKLLMIRRANPAIARGEYTGVAIEGSKVGGFTSAWEGTTVLVLHNPARSSETIDLSALGDFSTLRAAVGKGSARLDGASLTIDGQTSVVLD